MEHEIRAAVSLPTREKTQPVGLRGIIDRIDAVQGGDLRIADYKTSRNLKPRVHPNQLLRGTQAQMGIYAFLAAAEFTRPAGAVCAGGDSAWGKALPSSAAGG